MKQNFLVLYTARDGSSALINLLSKHRNVVVPLFEGMDTYAAHFESRNVPSELEKIFQTGVFSGEKAKPGEIFEKEISGIPADELSIGFKWRPWGDMDEVAEILKKNNVKVYCLFRRDFAELVASIHLTERMNAKNKGDYKDWHPQFEFLHGGASERAEITKKLESAQLRVSPISLLKIMAIRTKQAARFARVARTLRKQGVEVSTIFYEDFSADNLQFVNGILSEIGQPSLEEAQSSFQKPTRIPAKDRLVGFNSWLTGLAVSAFQRVYMSFVQQI